MRPELVNIEQAQYWNGDEADHWLAYEDRYETMLAPYTGDLLRAASVSRSDRVLDIGCGCGATTRAAARSAVDGGALGVDLSRRLLHRAEQRAREEGLKNVSFEHADAQVHVFDGPGFDIAMSRFGVMFFADPVAAFANLTRALRAGGGRLAVLCWADALENEWILVPGAAAAQHIALPSPDDPAGPGPFSLADPDRLVTVLSAAGLVDVAIEAVTEPLLLGSEVTGTVEFLEATGFGRRLLAGVDATTLQRVTDAISAALEPYHSAEGVLLGSKAWLATARRSK